MITDEIVYSAEEIAWESARNAKDDYAECLDLSIFRRADYSTTPEFLEFVRLSREADLAGCSWAERVIEDLEGLSVSDSDVAAQAVRLLNVLLDLRSSGWRYLS